jgi:type II secretory pathway predicted ATPase ExeA
LVRRYAASHVGPVVHLGFSALPGQELLRYVARQLGVTDSDDAVETLTGLRGCLSRICAEGRRPLWIIDDAQHIPNVATLEHIRMLSELDATNRPLVDLVLCGTAELVLRLPPALADRMSARCLLSVLSEEETSLYVNERLVRAGGSPELFTKPAIRALHQAANGLPRRMNRLADLALLITFGRSGKRVEPDAVDLAARDYAAMAV